MLFTHQFSRDEAQVIRDFALARANLTISFSLHTYGDLILYPYGYTYDDVGRLLTVSRDGVLVEEYEYNANGTRIYDMNSLRGIAGRSYDYDAEDHLLTAGGGIDPPVRLEEFAPVGTASGRGRRRSPRCAGWRRSPRR